MGLKVNFTKQEADSKPRSVEPPPNGEYQCNVVDIEVRRVNPESQNAGKPYWNIRFVIQEGKYSGTPLYGKIMLFEGKDGTLSSLSQFLKALGYFVPEGEFDVPEEDKLMGQKITVVGRKVPTGYDVKLKREVGEHFRITGYKAPYDLNTKRPSGSSLLP